MPLLAEKSGLKLSNAPEGFLHQNADDPSQQLRLIILRELPEHEALQDDWNRLVFEMEQPEVFYTYEWTLAVQRAYSASLKPLLLLAYRGECLVGVAALATGLRDGEATFLCATTADYCDFLSRPDLRTHFVDCVFARLRNLQIRKVTLPNLPAESASVEAIKRAGSKRQYHLLLRPAYACARVVLGSQEGRAEMKRNVQRKKMLQRNLNCLKRQGRLYLNHLKTWDELRSELPQFIRAHVARFLSTGRISNQVSAERRRFLEELARMLCESGWLTLTRLMAGESPVAWNYGFQFAGSWFWYQPTMDMRLEKYSPGFCLLSKIIEEACDNPNVKLVDLGLGAESYKERFSSGMRQTLHVTASRSWSEHCYECGRHYAVRVAKASPYIEGLARRLRRRAPTARDLVRLRHFSDIAGSVLRRVCRSLFCQDEVVFYQFTARASRNGNSAPLALTMKAIDLELLATAAMQYPDDLRTRDYLLRSAARLTCADHRGYALLNSEDIPVHFCWIASFGSFYMSELNIKLSAPSADSVLLFDCWTPDTHRGQGFYPTALQLVATKVLMEGKSAWIFSAVTNTPSVRGIEKAGFQRRYSLVRQKRLFWGRVQTCELSEIPAPSAEISVVA